MATITREEAAQLIERFVNLEADPYEWDDFTSKRYTDPLIEHVRAECVDVHEAFPPTIRGTYCSDEGMGRLRELAATLRDSPK